MYICLCKQITDQQIENAILDGANSIKAIQDQLGASTQCGCCMDTIKDMIAEHFIPIKNIRVINSAHEQFPLLV